MSDAFWAAISAIVVALITAISAYYVRRMDPESTPDPASPERSHVEATTGESTDGVSEQLVRMLHRAFSDIDDVKAELKSEREHSAKQDRRISHLSARLTTVRTSFRPIIRWMDAGAEPPAPEIADEVRRIIDDLDD